jgi:NADH-quinone oxidoreductase subunit L
MLDTPLISILSAALAPIMSLASEGAAGSAHTGIVAGPAYALLIPALPILACIISGLCAAFGVRSKLPAWITVAALAGAFAVTLSLFWQNHGLTQNIVGFRWIDFAWGPGIGQQFTANFALYVDGLTCLWMLFVTGLATLIALYASEYMSHDVGPGYCRFFAAFGLFVFSMTCLVMGNNLLMLFLGWEGVGLCSYLLIGYFYKKPSAVAAAKKAFIVNRIGDLGLVLGILLTFVHFGSIEYATIFAKAQVYIDALKAGQISSIPLIVQTIPLLLMIGAFGKSAQLPLYVWLPDAMEGPTPVSALIHAATMVTAGVYLIARTYPLFLCSEFALPIVAWVGALTALLAATIGMAQFDIKRIMAYSTVSQLGYMFAGLGVLSTTGAAFHVLTHAFFKALLFLCCGAVMHGFAGQLDLRKLSGVMKMPGWKVVGFGMLVGCLNLAGFPIITAGYWSKDMILAEAFTTPGFATIGWILLITAGLTAYYTFRVFFRVFAGPVHYEPGEEFHAEPAGHHDAAHAHAGSHHADHGHDHGHSHATGAKHDDHAHHEHGHGSHFHPHAPGWAINLVLATLSIASFAAIGLYFLPSGGPHGGWAAGMLANSTASYESPFVAHEEHGESPRSEHAKEEAHAGPIYPASALARKAQAGEMALPGRFLGFDPHKAMYYVSAIVGIVGILIAAFLHLLGRTSAATSRADSLLPLLGPIPHWAQGKWYVDDVYDAIIRKPLLVLSHVFHFIDKLFVDGLVNLAGYLPRALGGLIRPSQSGVLHGYAAGMAGGAALLILIALLASL